jgi:hypothetical protein
MQLDGIHGKAHTDRVADGKAACAGQASNLQLVGRNVEAQRAAATQDHLPRFVLRAERGLAELLFELEISQVDRDQNDSNPNKNG